MIDADSGWYENSLIYYKPEADGIYYLTVTSTPRPRRRDLDRHLQPGDPEPDDHGDTAVGATESRSVATRRRVGSTTTTACSVPRRLARWHARPTPISAG